ncbi:ABC transporter permease [Parafrankia discariae]|uniref:ABC transporter permease n=1 Tax=Parafrankia discariae TaxID=365528 RepID=UPI00036F6D8D|nr:ABC-2 family transporter protein [Parafrankia discariae]
MTFDVAGRAPAPGASARALASARMWGLITSAGARRYVTYRAAVVASVISNIVLTVLRGHLALAVWEQRPGLAGYDITSAVTFAVVGQALVSTFAVFGGMIDLPWRVRRGTVETDLVRPVGFQRWWLGLEVGRAGVYLATRAVPAGVVGAFLFDLRLPGSVGTGALFAASLVLALLVSFGLRYLVALSAFWLTDDRGVQAVAALVMMFFSGAVLPLGLFPGALGTIAGLLPFGAVVQAPMDLYLGSTAGGTAYLGSTAGGPERILAYQATWALLLSLAGHVLTTAALRRLVVQGG